MHLDDLCELVIDQFDPNVGRDTLYVGLEHLRPGRIERYGGGRSTDVRSGKSIFRKGDVLYGKLRPYLDKACVADEGGVCSTEMLVMRPRSQTDPRFLVGLLHSSAFIKHAMSGVTGVQHPRTSWQHLREFELPYFDASGQRAIGEIVAAASASVSACEKTIDEAGTLKRAAMRALFTRGLRGGPQKDTTIGPIPVSWSLVELGEIARIGNGSTPNRKAGRYWGGDIPYLTSGKMYSRDIVTADEFVTEQALEDYHLPRLAPGTILMAIVGQGKTLGHCAVLKIDATVSRHVGYLVLDQSRIRAEFTRQYLEMNYDYLRTLAASNGSTRGALTAGILRRLSFPLPTLDEQDEIASVLDAIDQKADFHRRKRALLDLMLKALLNDLTTGYIRPGQPHIGALRATVCHSSESSAIAVV